LISTEGGDFSTTKTCQTRLKISCLVNGGICLSPFG
jgi:hypothetical protein